MSVQPGLRSSNDLRVVRKMATFQLFFQSWEQVVVRRDQIRRIEWVIKTLEAHAKSFRGSAHRPDGPSRLDCYLLTYSNI